MARAAAKKPASSTPAKATSKTAGKKTPEPAVKTSKTPAKAAAAVKAGKAQPAAKVSKPAASSGKAVKAAKAAPAKPTKAAEPAKGARKAPAKTVAKAKSPTVARNTRPTKKSVEGAQVAEAKSKRGGTATKTPPVAAPVETADFAPKTLEKLRRLLEEERETYLRQARDLAAEAEALATEREPGDTQFDEESGEGDTLNVERERDLALSASATQAVEEIDRALRRMDAGSYGICERCGKKIAVARLEALPFAALCIECKSREERRR
jgi:RNA polymerase-binding protein DksA